MSASNHSILLFSLLFVTLLARTRYHLIEVEDKNDDKEIGRNDDEKSSQQLTPGRSPLKHVHTRLVTPGTGRPQSGHPLKQPDPSLVTPWNSQTPVWSPLEQPDTSLVTPETA